MANIIEQSGALKDALVNYVGHKINPEKEEVTIEMIVEVLAAEFPELVLSLAEENFLRGYEAGLSDQTAGFMSEEGK
tara:strand:- start:1536 stop:1766 length:231 start_codon:yes stop_codon:yes gene_type:complete